MSFQPVIPLSGFAGWRFLERTLDTQQAAYASSPPVARATEHFRAQIAKVSTAADLVADRQLLSVALGAFGLDEDINNGFFIRTILEQGTTSEDALANRLADKRYAEFSAAFGFADRILPRTQSAGFAEEIVARFEKQQFARAVGQQDNGLRLALNISEGLQKVVAQNSTNGGRWFAIMGSPPLRQVFETALGLPAGIVNIDLDQQRDIFRERARAVLGTDDVGRIGQGIEQDDLRRLFLIRSEVNATGGFSGGAAALVLLQNAAGARR